MATITIRLSDSDMIVLRRIARNEVRTVEQQVLYFVRTGIEAYYAGRSRRRADQEHDETPADAEQ
jgi:hypothetical protein